MKKKAKQSYAPGHGWHNSMQSQVSKEKFNESKIGHSSGKQSGIYLKVAKWHSWRCEREYGTR